MKTQERIKQEIERFKQAQNLYPTDATIQFSIRALEWVLAGTSCPYCAEGTPETSFKHADLQVDDSGNTEYTDVMIYRCGHCKQVWAEAY